MASVHFPLSGEYAFLQLSSNFSSRLTCASIFFSHIVFTVLSTVSSPVSAGFVGIWRVIIFLPSSDLRMSLTWVKSLPTYLGTSRKFSAYLPVFWLPEKSNTYPFRSAQQTSNGRALAINVLPLLLRNLDQVDNNGFVPPTSTFVVGCCLISIIV